jgi:hypothetical protein
VLLKAILNAHALEHDRIRNAAWQIISGAPFVNRGRLRVPTPSQACLVDAVNLCHDPQGIGSLQTWTGDSAPVRNATGAPPGWLSYVTCDGSELMVALGDVAPALRRPTVTFYCYALCQAPATLELAGDSTTYETVEIPGGAGWLLARLSGSTAAPDTLRLTLTADLPALTGVTLCADFDPGAPFSGDSDDEFNFAYRWAGIRNASVSNRHTTEFDALAVAEAEANIGIAPLTLNTAQRQEYLTQRFQARHQPHLGDPEHDTMTGQPSAAQIALDHSRGWITGFKQQIGDVIRADGTAYDDNRTTVLVDAPDRSFRVEIAYAADGPLVDRIIRLIQDIKPAHLAFDAGTALDVGGFLADVGKTDETPL